jgi:alkylation response protein AidB-like acyl-CoA dehydrogenase
VGEIEGMIAFPAFSNPCEIEAIPFAVRDGNGYTLSGSLEYLVLGSLASRALIPAKIDGYEGFSFFLVDLERAGIVKSGPVQSLGLHACPAVDIGMSAVMADIIGDEGGGNRYFEAAADRLSAAAAAISSGIMKGSLKEALDYSAERVQGGRAIFNWSALRMIIAEMAVKVEIADMAVSRACGAVMEEWPGAGFMARAAALHVQELAAALTTDGIQVLGGYGYMKDFGQEKRFRDAKQAQSLLGVVPLKKLKLAEQLIGE